MNWTKVGEKTLAWLAGIVAYQGVDSELDLNMPSRETLLALLAEQQVVTGEQRVVIAELQRRIGALESRLNHRGPTGMPGNKPSSGQQAPEIMHWPKSSTSL